MTDAFSTVKSCSPRRASGRNMPSTGLHAMQAHCQMSLIRQGAWRDEHMRTPKSASVTLMPMLKLYRDRPDEFSEAVCEPAFLLAEEDMT